MEDRNEIKHTLERAVDDTLQTSRVREPKKNDGNIVLSRVNY